MHVLRVNKLANQAVQRLPQSGIDAVVGAKPFTALQGQYLAFIRAYLLINGRPPAEADLQRFFGVTPPTIHQMILTLEKCRLISRSPGMARSVRLLVQAADLPPLEEPTKGSR